MNWLVLENWRLFSQQAKDFYFLASEEYGKQGFEISLLSTAESRTPHEGEALAEYLPIFTAVDVSFQITC